MPTPGSSPPLGLVLALLVALPSGLYACRAGQDERCACAEDCREGFSCVAGGRVLAAGECTPVVGEDAVPGLCKDASEALDEGGGGVPEVFEDLGAKRDFDPAPLPEPETASGTETGTDGGSTTASSSSSGADTSTSGSSDSSGSTSSGSSSGT